MSAAFTPGPWTANFTRLDGSVVGWHISAAPHGSTDAVATADLSGELRGPEEEEANARLIASCPLLLEAAQAAWNCIAELPPTQARVEVAQMLQAAVEAATGEQP